MSHFMHTPLRGVEATKLLNHNELRPNIWKSDTEITVIMVNYGRAQSLLRCCMKTKADTGEKETLISRLLMICELQTLISAAIISSLYTALPLLDTFRVNFCLYSEGLKTLKIYYYYMVVQKNTSMLALKNSMFECESNLSENI